MTMLRTFGRVLSVANGVARGIRSYPKHRRTQRLRRQWMEKAGLQPECLSAEHARTEEVSAAIATADRLSPGQDESPPSDSQTRSVRGFSHAGSTPEDVRNTFEADAQTSSRVDHGKVAMFMMAEINKEQLRLAILLMLLGASIVIFCLGAILLIVHSLGL